MKQINLNKMKKLSSVLILLVLFAYQTMGQKSYEMEVLNLVQVNETEFTFDVRMRNTNSSEPFAIAAIQWQFSFNTAILNSGLLNNTYLTYVSGTTDLVGSAIIPDGALFTTDNVVIQWITNALSDGSETTLFGDGSWKRIGTFKVQLRNSTNTAFHNFGDVAHNLDFVSGQVIVNWCDYTLNGGLAYRSGTNSVIIENPTLTNSLSTRQLAGYWFTGTGNWSDTQSWNNVTTENGNTLPGANSNAIINGNCTVKGTSSYSLLPNGSGNGGELTILTGAEPLYSLELVANGVAATVTLYDLNYNVMSNPLDNISAGTQFYINTTGIPPSGAFINWTDQNSNVISTSAYFGPYTMPSSNMVITANWTSGTKNPIPTKNTNDLYSSLTLSPGAELTVDKLYNDNANGSQAILIQSTASGTGSLIQNNTGVEATVQRYITGGTWTDGTDGWHLLSSPVAAQAINPEFTTSGGGAYDFYAWSEPNQLWMNQKVPENGISTFNVGQGYLVAYENTDTKVFSGALNTANQSVTLTNGGGDYTGWNLLGNPYSSALTWSTGWTLTNIGGVAQIWNESSKDYTLINSGAAIPAMNGFMVYTSAASQSLSIPYDARVHNATPWYKSSAERIKLTVYDTVRQSAKEAIVEFNADATPDFDLAYDAFYLQGYGPKFYTVSEGLNYSLNALPGYTTSFTVPLSFVKNESDRYYIELNESIAGETIFLTDYVTNTTVDLSAMGQYHFTAEDGDLPERFLIHFAPVGTEEIQSLPARVYTYDNTLVINGLSERTKVDVLNIAGQTLKHFETNANGTQRFSLNLATGIYVVKLSSQSNTSSTKVVIR